MNKNDKKAEQKLRVLGAYLRKFIPSVSTPFPATEDAIRRQYEEETEGSMVKAGKRKSKES